MESPPDEPTFLRNLVKASRQRPTQVKWTDRDGSARHTALTAAEAVRLNAIAHRLGISPGELIRRTAHLPAPKTTPSRETTPVVHPGMADAATPPVSTAAT